MNIDRYRRPESSSTIISHRCVGHKNPYRIPYGRKKESLVIRLMDSIHLLNRDLISIIANYVVEEDEIDIVCNGKLNMFHIKNVMSYLDGGYIFKFDFGNCNMSKEDLIYLLDYLSGLPIKISDFNINWAPIGSDPHVGTSKTIDSLNNFLKNHPVEDLNLEACDINISDFEILVNSFTNVKSLQLQLNNIFYDSSQEFQKERVFCNLEKLFKGPLQWITMSDNDIPTDVLYYIIDNLPESVSTLYLSNTSISGEHIPKIKEFIQNTHLEDFIISRNNFTCEEREDLVKYAESLNNNLNFIL